MVFEAANLSGSNATKRPRDVVDEDHATPPTPAPALRHHGASQDAHLEDLGEINDSLNYAGSATLGHEQHDKISGDGLQASVPRQVPETIMEVSNYGRKLPQGVYVHHAENNDEDNTWIYPPEFMDSIPALAGYLKCRNTQELQILLNSTSCRQYLEHYYATKTALPRRLEGVFPTYTSGQYLQIFLSITSDEALSGKDLCGKLGSTAEADYASLVHCMVQVIRRNPSHAFACSRGDEHA